MSKHTVYNMTYPEKKKLYSIYTGVQGGCSVYEFMLLM